MKIISPLPRKRGRLEIIPLIDIMFFLLAAFMIVSINKIKVESLKVVLPTDVPATLHETKEDFVSISMDAAGNIQMDKERITTKEQFMGDLKALFAKNPDQKILISADRNAHNGDVMTVLGRIRAAGFQKVAFNIKNERTGGADAAPAAEGPVTPALESAAPSAPIPPLPPAAPTSSAAPAPPAAPAVPSSGP